MPLFDDRDITSQPTVVFRDTQKQNGVTQKADIDVQTNVLTQQAVLGHD